MVKVNRKEAEPMKEGYVANRFASLYYKEMGQGMPLIMLHGNGESHEIFARLSELMSRYYRVILMDSRGPRVLSYERGGGRRGSDHPGYGCGCGSGHGIPSMCPGQ